MLMLFIVICCNLVFVNIREYTISINLEEFYELFK